MNNLKVIGIVVVACVISFSIGKHSGGSRTELIEIVAETKKTDTTRVVDKKETIRPDGTRIIETVTSTKRLTDSELNKDTSSKTLARPEWRANVLYFPAIPNHQDQLGILDVQKRILSEIYLGVSISSQKQIGLSISIGF